MIKWFGAVSVIIVEIVKGAGQAAKDHALKLIAAGIFIVMVAYAISLVLETSSRTKQQQQETQETQESMQKEASNTPSSQPDMKTFGK